MVHREGKTYIIIGSITVIIFSILMMNTTGMSNILCIIFQVLSFIFLLFSLQFFRNPKRSITQIDDDIIYAPADGKVVVIEETEESEYFNDRRLQVSIFMSPLNVHANRVPISGKVAYSKYHKGKYLFAWHPKSSTENERTTTVIKQGQKEILVRQIAGAVARRIKNYVKEGQDVTQGEELGFIKFGSRADIFLPLGTKVNVEINQMVKGNIDVIANW